MLRTINQSGFKTIKKNLKHHDTYLIDTYLAPCARPHANHFQILTHFGPPNTLRRERILLSTIFYT